MSGHGAARTQWLSPHGPESACGDRPGHAEDEVEVMMDAAIKVLLVEDNPVDARIAAELLGKNGAFELTHVARLSEAAQQLSEQRFDAVLLDLMLPDSSGLATVDSVQERAPDVPIVVYTAASGPRTCCSRAKRSAAARRSSCPRAWPRRS